MRYDIISLVLLLLPSLGVLLLGVLLLSLLPCAVRSISEIASCFFGPRPWHIEIRHRVKKTSTINLLGFEALKLEIRRLKLWKPGVYEI